jgi:hypothetical protein
VHDCVVSTSNWSVLMVGPAYEGLGNLGLPGML